MMLSSPFKLNISTPRRRDAEKKFLKTKIYSHFFTFYFLLFTFFAPRFCASALKSELSSGRPR